MASNVRNVFHLQRPDFLEDDSANISIEPFHDQKILVGNENGCYITSLDGSFSEEINKFRSKEVPALCCPKDDPNIFYVGSENSIYKFDFRCLNKEIISFNENSDDINQVRMNDNSSILGACDDSGECKLIDTKQNKLYRTLRNRHENICSTLVFMKNRPDEVVTGGLDCQMFVWNYSTLRLTQGVNMQNMLEKLGDESVKMFNPPLINSIDISDDGRLLAAGLGNGTLQIFHVLKGKYVLAPSQVVNYHGTTGISSVHFLKQTESKYILVSGGNDCNIKVWKLPVLPKISKKQKQIIPDVEIVDDISIKSMLFQEHIADSKVNYLTSANKDDKTILLSADQSPNLKAYIFDVT